MLSLQERSISVKGTTQDSFHESPVLCEGWLCLLPLSDCVHVPGARGAGGDGAG